jgi:hypothetical protein
MKIFWSWQSDTPEQIGKYLVRDALKSAIHKLKQAEDIEESPRDDLHLDQDTQGTPGSPDLVRTIFGKIEKSEVVVADERSSARPMRVKNSSIPTSRSNWAMRYMRVLTNG